MKDYRIEIVSRGCDRFGWSFVRFDERGRRVLARSSRSYGSKKRVHRAIAALKEADVFDATKEYAPLFPLPASRFRLVPGVVPLVVDESPLEDDDADDRLGRAEAPDDDEGDDEVVVVEEVDAVVDEDAVAEEALADEQKHRARRRAT